MKIIVTFSGGKDSLAALLWVREHITKNFTTVFCDTGWEHPLTYEYSTVSPTSCTSISLRSSRTSTTGWSILRGKKSAGPRRGRGSVR